MLYRLIFFIVFVSMILAQVEMNFSYELKYGRGKQVTSQVTDIQDYSYFENLLDINTYFGNNIYLYTQLEYSDPPVFGLNRKKIDSMLPTFYLEYSKDYYSIKIGQLYELYGRGLSYYSFQDQSIDYDNSLKGLSVNYLPNDNLKLSILLGTGKYEFRSLPINRISNYSFNTNVRLSSIDYENQFLGNIQLIYLYQESFFPTNKIDGNSSLIGALCNDNNELGDDLQLTASLKMLNGSCMELGQYPYTAYMHNLNLNWSYFFGPFDLVFDKAWIYYDKIHANEVFGSRFYTSIYTEIFDIGITYEYKNYFTPYLIKSFSNPPIVYRESNSILASRNAHSINFGNEIGHQLEFNRNINNSVNIIGNFSIAYRHQNKEMENQTFIDFIRMEEKLNLFNYFPYRQTYFEVNGWSASERLFYKIGIDYFMEYSILATGKNITAATLPTQWLYKMGNRSSITVYLESQIKKENKSLEENINARELQTISSHYLSFSYNHLGKLIVTNFIDQEIKDNKTKHWLGLDLSYRLTSESQISIFYGSQKGGLVCANGICAEQPAFSNGVKFTLRTIF